MNQAPVKPAAHLPIRTLAYIGDAIYELHVRLRMLECGVAVDDLHRKTVKRVSASGQARLAQRLQAHLLTDELQVFKRARNHKSIGPQRGSVADYRLGTALEAVFGYVKLKPDLERLAVLLALSDTIFEEFNDGI
jgi:ribonuclease-3 family protein